MIKHIQIILSIIFLFPSCSTLNEKKQEKPEKVIISGSVRNFNPDKSEISFSVNRIGLSQESLSCKLDSLGCFSVSFDSYIPTDVWVNYYTNFLVLAHPGDSIYLEFDGNTSSRPQLLSEIKFGGDAAKSNQDAAIFQQMFFSSKLYDNGSANDKAIKEYEVNDYTLYLDTLERNGNELYSKFVADIKPNKETKNWAHAFINQNYINALIGYPFIHRGANQLKFSDWDVPASYYDPLLKQLPIKEQQFISGNAVSSLIGGYSSYYARMNSYYEESNKKFRSDQGFLDGPNDIIDSITVYSIINYTSDTLLRQLGLTNLFSQYFNYSKVELFEKYRDIADRYIQEPFLKEPLLKKYNQIIAEKEKLPTSANKKLNDVSNSLSKQLIDSISTANKGKVIFVNCWGTWCKPCRAEMPYLKDLMLKFNEKEVVSVFLCLESEEKEWKKAIADLQIRGQHILLTKEQSANIRQALTIKGVPYHFIIDKNGEIVENSWSIRSDKLKENIDSLLMK